MKKTLFLSILVLLLSSNQVFAYGSSSSSKKSCKKPQFSQFTPKHLATASAGAAFSFIASSNTQPNSIEVTIKDQPIQITIKKQNNYYQVSGLLPSDLKTKYARLSLQALAAKKCKGNDGWLLKISE